jgi:NADH-quinone oxidoreductase subunit E
MIFLIRIYKYKLFKIPRVINYSRVIFYEFVKQEEFLPVIDASKRAAIDAIIEKYHGHKSSLIQILLDVQKENRWLPQEYLQYIAQRLSVPLPRVYQIATFYKAFSLKARGRHLVTVCMGTACHVRGAPTLLDRISEKMNVRPSMTSTDGRFTLLTVNCMGCCALGPVMAIDETYYSNPSDPDIEDILGRYA